MSPARLPLAIRVPIPVSLDHGTIQQKAHKADEKLFP